MEPDKKLSKQKALNKIKIPERKGKTTIHPQLWYVIYEENLLAPKVFKYCFRDEYYAQKFVDEKLQGYRTNVLSGKALIKFGFTAINNSLSKLTTKTKGPSYKYQFTEGLSSQRKKSLRTAYRRSYRRRLKKLLKRKE